MSEKQFDMFDERFREAAEQHEPPFDEASWNRLEAKLDADKRRRRPLAWWWLTDAGILGLLVYLIFSLTATQKISSTTDNNKLTNTTTAGIQTEIKPPAPAPANAVITTVNAATSEATLHTTQPVSQSKTDGSSKLYDGNAYRPERSNGNDIAAGSHQSGIRKSSGYKNEGAGDLAGNDQLSADPNSAGIPGKEMDAVSNPNTGDDAIAKTAVAAAGAEAVKPESSEAATKAETLKEPSGIPPADEKSSKKKSTEQNAKGFYVYGAAGPEWSFVKGENAGNSTLAWGFGVGYKISNKWAVQAGYFSTRKLYDAGPGAYKPQPGTYYYNLTINSVKADCQVTEIPVMVSYTALERKRQSLQASVGLASLIMNSEEYHYDYMRANSTPGYAYYDYQTHNSHLFATLMLSAAYHFKITKSLSVGAAPFFKIPLYGVGEGSIKIFSYGVMGGLSYSLPSLRKK